MKQYIDRYIVDMIVGSVKAELLDDRIDNQPVSAKEITEVEWTLPATSPTRKNLTFFQPLSSQQNLPCVSHGSWCPFAPLAVHACSLVGCCAQRARFAHTFWTKATKIGRIATTWLNWCPKCDMFDRVLLHFLQTIRNIMYHLSYPPFSHVFFRSNQISLCLSPVPGFTVDAPFRKPPRCRCFEAAAAHGETQTLSNVPNVEMLQ